MNILFINRLYSGFEENLNKLVWNPEGVQLYISRSMNWIVKIIYLLFLLLRTQGQHILHN